jgi:hypothetical protein
MKRSSKYVGLDVHQATTVSTVRDDTGRVLARTVVPTEAEALREFFRGMRGPVHVALEEGTQAQWLHDLLAPVVHRIVVCDPVFATESQIEPWFASRDPSACTRPNESGVDWRTTMRKKSARGSLTRRTVSRAPQEGADCQGNNAKAISRDEVCA